MRISIAIIGLALFGMFALGACDNTQEQKGITIQGQVGDAANLNVAFERIPIGDDPVPIATAQVDGSGGFEISSDKKIEPGMYRLRFGAQGGDLVLEESDHHIVFESNSLNDLANLQYSVEGSEATNQLINTSQLAQQKNFTNVNEVAEFVDEIENTYVAIRFVSRALRNSPDVVNVHESLSQRLTQSHPGSKDAQNYADLVAQMKGNQAQQASQGQSGGGIRVGMEAPDIEMEGPEGEIYRLSDLRGNIVLLDFWAAWCRPCRIANPKVVEIYHQYKDEGFKVFNVSLDGLDSRTKARMSSQDEIDQQMAVQRQRWIDAIEQDGLDWPWHVSELKRWECEAAQTYGVRGIPRTYLIDRDGKIAAINPRAQTDLERELQKLL